LNKAIKTIIISNGCETLTSRSFTGLNFYLFVFIFFKLKIFYFIFSNVQNCAAHLCMQLNNSKHQRFSHQPTDRLDSEIEEGLP